MSGTTRIILRTLTQNLVLGCALAMVAAGCAKEKSANAAAADLERAFQTRPPIAVEAPAQTAQSSPISPPAPQGDQAKQLVQQAVSALHTNGYAVAFATLRAAQTAPNITVDQYDAIEKARLAVEREMAVKAASGDPNAVQSLQSVQGLGH
jgi:hypothetical protein